MKHDQKYDILSLRRWRLCLRFPLVTLQFNPQYVLQPGNRPVTSGTQRFIRISETGIVHSKPCPA